ncbi:MAG: hypothetical protein ACREVJ_05725 [Gammaproteobacteria bacterium]
MISGKLTTIKDKLDIFPFATDAVFLGALIGLRVLRKDDRCVSIGALPID